jgi:hypothetical protein
MINLDLEKQISAQVEQTIKSYLDSDELKDKIQQQIDLAIGSIIENVAGKIYSEVVNRSQIADHVRSIVVIEANNAIQEQSASIVKSELSKLSVRSIIEEFTKREVNLSIEKMQFPKGSIDPASIAWYKGAINANHVFGGIHQQFNSTGIEDKASAVQLTILDDHVVAEGQFTAMNITAADTVTAKNLSLTGTLEIGTEIIDHGPFSQLIQQHASMMAEQALEPYKPLLIKDEPIIMNGTINPSVSFSNLRRVGNLQDLTVTGDAKFSETMFVSAGKKVGINTEEPRGALTVWDEDSEVSFMRTNRQTMFIGTTRTGSLELGTNSASQILISENLIDIKCPIRLMGLKISVANQIPEHQGEQNELVFVKNSREDQPKLYTCLGNNRWQALK